MNAFQYSKWEHFAKVINKAKISCNLSNYNVDDHFPVKGKIVKSGATTKEVIDLIKRKTIDPYKPVILIINKKSGFAPLPVYGVYKKYT